MNLNQDVRGEHLVVYADIVLLLNLCIDYLLLLLTAVILKKKVKKWRLLCGSLLGSILVLFALTPVAFLFAHPISKLLFSILIVYATFGFTRIRTFFTVLCMFYFVTFMVGGGLIGLHFFIQDSALQSVISKQTSFGDPISWLFVLIGFPVIYYFSKKRIADIELTNIRYDQIVAVEVTINGTQLHLKGLIDNGNQLYDPISRTPIMIVEAQTARSLFPEWLLEQSKQVTELFFDHEEHADWMKRVRIIPYRGIGQKDQLLVAVKPDTVRVCKDGEMVSVTNVFVGINHTKLSSDNEYTCILHPKMLLSTTA